MRKDQMKRRKEPRSKGGNRGAGNKRRKDEQKEELKRGQTDGRTPKVKSRLINTVRKDRMKRRAGTREEERRGE